MSHAWTEEKINSAKKLFNQNKNIRGASILSLAANDAIQQKDIEKINILLSIDPFALPEEGIVALLDMIRGDYFELPQRKIFSQKSKQALRSYGWTDKDFESFNVFFNENLNV